MKRELKIGLALAGGGARGGAHIGVLQVLHENNVGIDMITGSSAGAVIGAMFAATLDPGWVETRFREFLASDVFRAMGIERVRKSLTESGSFFGQVGRYVKDKLVITFALNRRGIISRDRLVQAIQFLLPVRDFADLQIPLKVVATDLNTGAEYQYSSGDLVKAVSQSSLIPGYVSPQQENGQLLVDGGISSPVPINSLLNSGMDFTIAVDIARRDMEALEEFNILDLMARSEQVSSVNLSDELAGKADFVIQPDVGGAHWSEFHRFDEFVENGTVAAEKILPRLKQQLALRNRWSYRLRRWIRETV